MSEHKTNINYWLLTFIIGVIVALVSHYIIAGKFFDLIAASSNADNSKPLTTIRRPTQAPSVEIESETKKDIRTNEFNGNIGKWTALFHLTFDYANKKIYGTYYYPNRPGVVYKMTGKIFDSAIELTEYTGDEISATCRLRTRDNICFSGVMNNTDGRNLNMDFCKQ